jgi:hypothetical protein
MSKWKSINMHCGDCDHTWHDIVERAEEEGSFTCPECGELSGRKTFSAPTVLRASYHDGKRRFNDHREINDLKKERATRRRDERVRIEKEISKLGGKVYDK